MGKIILRPNNKGYTLTEVLTVVVIVGIIAAFALPQYSVILEKSRASEAHQTLMAILAAQKRFAVESGGTYTNALANLDVTFPASGYFGAPAVSNNPANLGSVTRTGSYTLSINSDGVISCTGGPTGLCTKMGY